MIAILYENGPFYVCKGQQGLEVRERGVNCYHRVALIEDTSPVGQAKAREEADRRAQKAGQV